MEEKVCLFICCSLQVWMLALLGNTTSQNGASCGHTVSNGNTMLIKHIVVSDLLSHQA
jgi:hypothetical protein